MVDESLIAAMMQDATERRDRRIAEAERDFRLDVQLVEQCRSRFLRSEEGGTNGHPPPNPAAANAPARLAPPEPTPHPNPRVLIRVAITELSGDFDVHRLHDQVTQMFPTTQVTLKVVSRSLNKLVEAGEVVIVRRRHGTRPAVYRAGAVRADLMELEPSLHNHREDGVN